MNTAGHGETPGSGEYDAILVGGGIMSATLATLLHQVEPQWKIAVIERMDELALESSGPWNNAGTGHAALCELNYAPQAADGTVDVAKAVTVNEQFQVSRQLWSFLVTSGHIPDASAFIQATPHISFVWGADNVDYLKKRFEAFGDNPLFAGMEYSEDPAVIAEWAPLLFEGRTGDTPVAATRSVDGTDVNFGALTTLLLDPLAASGSVEMLTGVEIKKIKRVGSDWSVTGKSLNGGSGFAGTAPFVFVGAGGQALTLLQKSGIDEIKGFGGFPVSGEFWRTTNPEITSRHQAKVYGKAAVGAPPMSVPHLDTRMVGDTKAVMFGPYAGFSPRYLKHGSLLDLFKSIRLHNLWPMIVVGLTELGLVKYLITELLASKKKQLSSLQEYFPDAKMDDWEKITAGQRVQVIKKVKGKGGVLQFGTEVITAADGSIAGLLGASPGASIAPHVMLDVMGRCFPEKKAEWEPKIKEMIPSYGTKLSDQPELAKQLLDSSAETLGLQRA